MNDPQQREEILFNEAIQLGNTERAAYLKNACGDDEPLRLRVEELLQAHEQTNVLLDKASVPVAAKTLLVDMSGVPPAEKIGDRIGRYKLREQIGEGGCGVVYVAEQEEPVRRRVALKVIKLGMDTKQVIARFEAERQALALMDHPNIAKVFDAGATETGRPYFVMELVRGIRITDYCDENHLSTAERLKLFNLVCQAIQHAHQKGIIHRDIKPSNILVTLHDGVPVPKVIDFGIAKATEGRLTNLTIYTELHQFIGTPAYMSPEQAEMSGLDIDTRSDIYALGVLLYELLTGTPPFDPKELLASGLDQMRRTIREKEPARPSTRLNTMLESDQTTVAKHRRLDASKLVHLLSGDLDWIVMKALEKDRTRRYETANGLAADIQRHLSNEAVIACPPSRVYRFQKMVRRNRGAFAAATVIAFALVLGAVVSATQALRASRAEKQAMTESVKSQQVASFLVWIFGKDIQIAEIEGKQLLITDDIEIQPGDIATAEAMFRDILLLQKKHSGKESPAVALALNNIASLQEMGGDLAGADTTREEAIAILKRVYGETSSQVSDSLFSLAALRESRGNVVGAEILYREAIDLAVTNHIQRTAGVMDIINQSANLYSRHGFWKDAATNLAKGIELEPDYQLRYYLLAPVLIKAGDFDGYQRLSKAMLAQFGQTGDRVLAERTARTCLLVPNPLADLESANRLSNIAIDNCSTNDSDLTYLQFVKALAEFRRRRPDVAIDWAQKSLTQGTKSLNHGAPLSKSFNSSREVATYAVQAMAHHQLDHLSEARIVLNKAIDLMKQNSTKRRGKMGGTLLVDWLTAEILLHEARTLIEGRSAESKETK